MLFFYSFEEQRSEILESIPTKEDAARNSLTLSFVNQWPVSQVLHKNLPRGSGKIRSLSFGSFSWKN